MKFKYQIASGVLIVLILMGIVSSLAYRNIQVMQSSADWVSHTEEVMSSINKATKLLIDMETGQRGFLITGSEKFLEPYNSGQRQFETTINSVMWLVSDNPVQVHRLERIRERYRRWIQVAGEAEIQLRRDVISGKSTMDNVRDIVESERGKLIIDDIRDRFRVITETEQSLIIGRRLAAADAATQSQRFLVWGTLITFLVAIGWSGYSMLLLSRQVGGEPGQIERAARRLASGRVNISLFDDIESPTGIAASIQAIAENHRYLSEQADNITSGDYSVDIKLRSKNDVLGRSLLTMQKTLRELKNETDEQVWLNREVASFSAQMQKQSSLKDLAQSALTQLATLTRAGHGLLYLRKTTVEGKEGNEFVRFASFATTDNSHFPEQIMLGEGIIGQCALDGQSIALTDLPASYLRILSGLGESVPQHLLVFPILFEGATVGVVELASFREFSRIRIEFLERSLSILSVLVKAAADRQKTESLLEGSRELAQKIQAQSKTLASTNELLEKRSQQLKDLNQNLTKQAEVLKVQKRKLLTAKGIVDMKAEQLEKASNHKTDFLASMSHELRTPLTSLLICAQTLTDDKDKTLTEDQIYAAKTISEASNSLDSIINDILDLSKVEAGKVTIEFEKVSISDTIKKLTRQFEPVAEKQGLEFPVVENESLPEYVTTDALRLEQILRNLLSNAFKFTQNGSVTLQVGTPGADVTFSNSLLNSEKTIAFSVTDTGIGIAEEKQQLVFEAYIQATLSTSKKYGGTGLGLSISTRLAELLGGEIQVESKLGHGSSFTLYLPYESDRRSAGRDVREKPRDHAARRRLKGTSMTTTL